MKKLHNLGINRCAVLIKSMPLGQAIQIIKSEITGQPDTTEIEGELVVAIVKKSRFISGTCMGEKCSVCGKPATNKLFEEIPYNDPFPNRHNLTAYVCAEHFDMILKPYLK